MAEDRARRLANLYRYWLKIFAVVFDRAGPIIGPLMAYEVLTAFFLEAGFLGVMLFGINKVGKGLHCAATCAVAFGSLRLRKELAPFLWSLALFGLSFVGLAISIWPDVVPGRISIWEAAAPPSSQRFMLVGTAVMVPLILSYTAWSYWVFRGKVGSEGYH